MKLTRTTWCIVGGVVIIAAIAAMQDAPPAATAPTPTFSFTAKPKAASTPKPAPTPTETEVPSPAATPNLDALLLLQMQRAEIPEALAPEVKQIGHSVCSAFDAGATPAQVLDSLAQNAGDNGDMIGRAAGVGVQVYCPQYTVKLSG